MLCCNRGHRPVHFGPAVPPVKALRQVRDVDLLVEQPDDRYEVRQGLDSDGALYKMNNRLNSAYERVAKRGRGYERNLDSRYLERLVESYTRFFYDYAQSPLLIVNAAELDLAENESDYVLLLEQIQKTRSGRHYFNPAPIAI